MQSPGLYFPYVHIRDDDWLKTAALYWPSVRRLVPRGYATRDSPTAWRLADADILRDEKPEPFIAGLELDLVKALNENADLLVRDYSVNRAIAQWDGQPWAEGGDFDGVPALGWIHVTKFPTHLLQRLADLGLALRGRQPHLRDHHGRPEDWIGLHPALAGAYMTALAASIGRQAHFEPMTDQEDLKVATPNTDVGAALGLLLGRQDKASESASDAVAVETYVMLALQYVRPANLNVPVEKIVQCRESLAEELKAFRDYVASQRAELAELAAISIKHRRLEAFAEHVEHTIEVPLQKLERGLSLVGMEPARSLLVTGSFVPPAAIGALGVIPPTAGTAVGAVAAVGSAWWQVSRVRKEAKAGSPVGYLLDVRDRLTTKTLAARARKVLRGTYGKVSRS